MSKSSSSGYEHTQLMRFYAQRIVYAYCEYLLRFIDNYKTPVGRFFTQDFQYGFRGRSLLPFVLSAMRGISWRKTPFTGIELPTGKFLVNDAGYIDNQLTNRPFWFDIVSKSEVVTPQYISYLTGLLFEAVIENNKAPYVKDTYQLETVPIDSIERALESRGAL